MSEVTSTPSAAGPAGRPGPATSGAELAERLGAQLLELRVVATAELGGALRRIDLTADGLGSFAYEPGQDLMLAVAESGGRVVRRRYTIAAHAPDAAVVSLHVLLHGDGPGARWAAGVVPGDVIEAIGPRGKVVVDPSVDWSLFIGDETFLPAAASMAEAATAAGQTAVVVCEVDSLDDLPGGVPSGVEPIWVPRSPLRADPAPLLDALAALTLPTGVGHAFLGGEFHAVRALQHALGDAGLAEERISAKAYWRDATANADHGEPPRD